MTSTSLPEPATAGDPLFEHLRVIDDLEPRSGPVNMALDELLIGKMPGGAPLLRFYRWAVPTVSFGYFEPVVAARRLAEGRPVVRRMTGGGLVEHGDDLTYTLLVHRPDPLLHARGAESYRRIHAAVGLALARAGLRTDFHPDIDQRPQASDENACFHRPVPHDLLTGGRKIAGGAQRRTRAGMMHQGSIRFPTPTGGAWMDTVRLALPGVLARRCSQRALEAAEISRANELAARRYATDAWTNRR